MVSAKVSSSMTHFRNQASVTNQTRTQNIHGNPQFHTHTYAPVSPAPPNYDLGIRLGRAPQTDDKLFVGRREELQKLKTWLKPSFAKQHVVALYGLGGVGKTQLGVQYVKQYGGQYSSVFWLDAQDRKSLHKGLAELAAQVSDTSPNTVAEDAQQEELLAQLARSWLSQPANNRWLIVYDNYDNPRLPGIDNPTAFDIRAYFPFRAHGSILITTRSPRLIFAKQLPIHIIKDEQQALSILARNIGRSIHQDPEAINLVRRLGGLPLALVTAGAYMMQSANSCREYLQLYENSWHDLSQNTYAQLAYEQTLYSTWDISFQQVQIQHPGAAELLRVMAFFDHRDMSYELFHNGSDFYDAPVWWTDVVKNQPRLRSAFAILHDYSLLEITQGRYSLHPCVHDWTLEQLNKKLHPQHIQIAIHCIAMSASQQIISENWSQARQLQPHAHRLQHARVKSMMMQLKLKPRELVDLAWIYGKSEQYKQAAEMLVWALHTLEKDAGSSDTFIVHVLASLAAIYYYQEKVLDAEKVCIQALNTAERLLGSEHTSTLNLISQLGQIYYQQGKMDQSEQLYLKALQAQERVLGDEHVDVVSTVTRLASLYRARQMSAEADRMHFRVVEAIKKLLEAEHTRTVDLAFGKVCIYTEQSNVVEMEQTYVRPTERRENIYGPNFMCTLGSIFELGSFYARQGKPAEAEILISRALQGYEQVWGTEHLHTLFVLASLIEFKYEASGFTATENLFHQLLQRYAKIEHRGPSVKKYAIACSVATIYGREYEFVETEKWLERAVQGLKNMGKGDEELVQSAVRFLRELGNFWRMVQLFLGEKQQVTQAKRCLQQFTLVKRCLQFKPTPQIFCNWLVNSAST